MPSVQTKVIGYLDNPSIDTIQLGKINTFAGWAFLSNGNKITKIEVEYKDEILGTCRSGLRRDDVFQNYSDQKESRFSGFEGDIYVPLETTWPLVINAWDSEGYKYTAFKLNLQQVLLKQQVSNGLLDLARVDPSLLIDALYRKIAADANQEVKSLPSITARSMVAGNGSVLTFGVEAGQCLAYLKLLCSLQPTDRVLDIGCGCGRNAFALRGHVSEYVGFDIVPGLVDQARSFITDSNFTFLHFDLYSARYNPRQNAVKPEDFTFPFDDNSFNIVMLNSVFTHLLPSALNNYVQEISRVLKKKGRCFATVFLRQNRQSVLGGSWTDSINSSSLYAVENDPHNSFFSVADPVEYDKMVIYDLAYMNQIFENAGMTPVNTPLYGKWNGLPNGIWYQDIIVYQKNDNITSDTTKANHGKMTSG